MAPLYVEVRAGRVCLVRLVGPVSGARRAAASLCQLPEHVLLLSYSLSAVNRGGSCCNDKLTSCSLENVQLQAVRLTWQMWRQIRAEDSTGL